MNMIIYLFILFVILFVLFFSIFIFRKNGDIIITNNIGIIINFFFILSLFYKPCFFDITAIA